MSVNHWGASGQVLSLSLLTLYSISSLYVRWIPHLLCSVGDQLLGTGTQFGRRTDVEQVDRNNVAKQHALRPGQHGPRHGQQYRTI